MAKKKMTFKVIILKKMPYHPEKVSYHPNSKSLIIPIPDSPHPPDSARLSIPSGRILRECPSMPSSSEEEDPVGIEGTIDDKSARHSPYFACSLSSVWPTRE